MSSRIRRSVALRDDNALALDLRSRWHKTHAAPVQPWKPIFSFLQWLVLTVEKFPRDQKFLLGDRIQKTALDVLEALIEATYTRERRNHLARANLGLEKLRFFFRHAAEMRYMDNRRYEHAARSLDETGRLIGGWMKTDAAQAHAA
jgi:hypothetical protein